MTNLEIQNQIKAKAQNGSIDSDDLQQWINNGYHEIINKIVRTAEDYFGTSTTYSVTSASATYSLSSDFKKSVKVLDENNNPLQRVDFLRTESSAVGYFLWGDKIGFTPAPTSSWTCTHYYIYNPTDLSADSDIPDFDSNYHHLLVVWGLKEYYESQQDLEYSKYYLTEFKGGMAELVEELDTRDLQPKSVISGNPSEQVNEWISP